MASIAQPTFTREHVGRALRNLRILCQHNLRDRNALDRAALNLEACRWVYTNGRLHIESARNSGHFYDVTDDGCECQAGHAGIACWHQAARHLLRQAEQLAAKTTSVAQA